MKKTDAVLAAVMTMIASAALARPTETVLPQPPAGQFTGRIFNVHNRGVFLEAFSKGRRVSNVDTMYRTERLDVVLLYAGCVADAQGKCNVSANMLLFNPNGGMESSTVGTWNISGELPAPAAGEWAVAKGEYKLVLLFSPERKPVGEYLLTAEFTDHNADKTSVAWRVVNMRDENAVRQKALGEMKSAGIADPGKDINKLNVLGYEALYSDRNFEKALQRFQWNISLFPKRGALLYDSLGDAYLEAGDVERAIDAYESSLERGPGSDNGKEAIEKLKTDPGNLKALQAASRALNQRPHGDSR